MINGIASGADVHAALKALGLFSFFRFEDVQAVNITADRLLVTAVVRDSEERVMLDSAGEIHVDVVSFPVHWAERT